MGWLIAFFKLIFQIINFCLMIITYVATFITAIIIALVKEIKNSNQEKKYSKSIKNSSKIDNSIKKTNIKPKEDIRMLSNNQKSITNNLSCLKLYIKKEYKELLKNDDFNFKALNLEKYYEPTLYYNDYIEIEGYNVFESEECSSEKYGDMLLKIYNYCKNGFYATIGYDEENIEYKITIKENNIYINEKSIKELKKHYQFLKNKIIDFSEKSYEYFLYIEDETYYSDIVPNDDLDCDSITILADKLNETDDILIFEIPYMEEISTIIDIIEPKIINEYQKGQKRVFDSLPKIEEVEYEEPEILIQPEKENSKNKMTWEEEEFEREAELWDLSEEDRKVAKEERMSPADFVEAEEYDDDELLLDEWER